MTPKITARRNNRTSMARMRSAVAACFRFGLGPGHFMPWQQAWIEMWQPLDEVVKLTNVAIDYANEDAHAHGSAASKDATKDSTAGRLYSHVIASIVRTLWQVPWRGLSTSPVEGLPMLDDAILNPLTWPPRIDNYRRKLGAAYLIYEKGWVAGTWFISNSYAKQPEAVIGVVGSVNHRFRLLTVFRKL